MLTGQGCKYFGPFYEGLINANFSNDGKTLDMHTEVLW